PGSTGPDFPGFFLVGSTRVAQKPFYILVAKYFLTLKADSVRHFSKRRARESNPQLVAQQLISNQPPNHSVTLRLLCYMYPDGLTWATAASGLRLGEHSSRTGQFNPRGCQKSTRVAAGLPEIWLQFSTSSCRRATAAVEKPRDWLVRRSNNSSRLGLWAMRSTEL